MKKKILLSVTLSIILLLVLSIGVIAEELSLVENLDEPMASYKQAPELDQLVNEGELPPLEDRLPPLPAVVNPVEKVGEYGGTLKPLERTYTSFGTITRVFNESLIMHSIPTGRDLNPNLARSFEVSDDLKTITIHLRKGVKWSDGQEFTSEDVMFKMYDILWYSPDPEVTELDLAHSWWKMGGDMARVYAPDKYTIIIECPVPYADYHKLIAHNWLDPVPAHYLKQFHPEYTEVPEDTSADEMMQELTETYNSYLNPERPSLGAWIVDSVKEGDNMALKRNPYYWKVDPEGKQLPYIGEMVINYIKDAEVAKLRVISGEIDFYPWASEFLDPVVLQNQQSGDFSITPHYPKYENIRVCHGWMGRSSRDPEKPEDKKLADLMANEKFLHALQLGINNDQMLKARLGPELAESVFAKKLGSARLDDNKPIGMDSRAEYLWDYWKEWQRYDVEEANAILDELGLEIGNDGYRHYADGGERIVIDIGNITTYSKQAELIDMQAEKWEQELKIRTNVENKPWEAIIDPWFHNHELPFMSGSAGHWFWATDALQLYATYQDPVVTWVESGGKSGIEPHPEVKDAWLKLGELAEESGQTADPEKKFELALEATEITLKNQLQDALVLCGIMNPVMINNRIKNFSLWPGFSMQKAAHFEQWFIEE